MPAFLEDKLKQEYGDNDHAIYGTMNKLGAMHGNKETAKGRAMQRKHDADQIPKRMAGGGAVIPQWNPNDPNAQQDEQELAAIQAEQAQAIPQSGVRPEIPSSVPQPPPEIPTPIREQADSGPDANAGAGPITA